MPNLGITGSQNTKSHLAPYAPTIGTATDVGTSRAYDDGAASVSFTPSASGPVATSYEIYYSSNNLLAASGASSPIVVGGLTTGSSYSFYVKAVNAIGSSLASSTSNSVTITTVPSAPTSVTMSKRTAAVGSVTYSFSASTNTGGKSITGYTQTGLGSTRNDSPGSYDITGLNQGQSYTVSVTAQNANGSSAAATATATSSAYTCPQGGSVSGSQCFFAANATTNYACPACESGFSGSACYIGPRQLNCGNDGVGYSSSNYRCMCCDPDFPPNFLPAFYFQECNVSGTSYSCPFGTLSGTQCYYSATIG